MNTIYELNLDEVSNLIVDNLYEDAEVGLTKDLEGPFYVLTSSSAMADISLWAVGSNLIALTKDRYDFAKQRVESNGFTPLAIVATPEGIYEFNLDLINLNFELYSDGDKPDIMVAELPISKGKQILEFYPEFSNEEEYLDSLMGDAEPNQWDEGDEW
jgi:hypothetical protein